MNRRNFIKSMATFLALGAVARATRAAGVAEEGEQEVEKRDFGRTGWKLFPVVFGGIVSMQDGQPASDRYVAWAIEHGVNYFDVAPSYGDAQEKLGNSLKNDRRQVYLACKTAERLRRDAEKEFLASLRALHTDYLDVYQLHGLASQQDFDLAFGPGGAIELLDEAKRKGQVRKLGITAHSEEIALKALEAYDFDTVMFPLNWQLQLRNGYGGRLVREARKRGLGTSGIQPLHPRPWLRPEEHSASGLPKSW